MAIVDPTQNPDEQDENPSQADKAMGTGPQSTGGGNQPTQPAPAPSTGGGGGGANAAGAPAAGNNSGTQSSGQAVTGGTTATPAQENANSGWTNLNQYLNANSDQAGQMGQSIAGTINQAGNQAQNDISNLSSNFDSAVGQNTVQENQGAVNQAVTDAQNLTAGQTLSAADQSAFSNQANASYNGPNDVTTFGGYNQAQQDVNTATQDVQQTQSEAGRGTLLNQQYANTSASGYNQGENNLDQMLLQNSTSAQNALQAPAVQQWSNLTGTLNTAVKNGSQAVTDAENTDSNTANYASDTLGGVYNSSNSGTWQNNISNGLSNLQTTDQNSFNQIFAALNSENITQAQADAAASGVDLSGLTAQHIFGSDINNTPQGTQLASYLQQGNAPTLASYATADQYAQAQALAQLAGQQQSGFLNPSSIAQAGTAETTPAYKYNSTQEASDNATNQAEYTTGAQSLVNSINQGLQAGMISMPGGESLSSAMLPANASAQDIYSYLQNSLAISEGPQKSWIGQQLQALNQLQQSYGFQPFNLAGQPNSQTGGASKPGQRVGQQSVA